MSTQPMTLQNIFEEVYQLENSIRKIDHSSFESFLSSLINGEAERDEEKERDCILVFVLTVGKFIRARLTAEGFTSSSAYLDQVSGVNKSVEDGDKKRSFVAVDYPQGRIALAYSSEDKKADGFFQSVDREIQNKKMIKRAS